MTTAVKQDNGQTSWRDCSVSVKLNVPHVMINQVYEHLGSALTVVSAGGSVFGAGLADNVLMNLVPLIFIITPVKERRKRTNDYSKENMLLCR